MILTAHQPTYLPWLGLFHKIALADEFCFFDIAQLEHYSFEHRNKVNTATGPVWLSVPLLIKGHTNRKAQELEIDNTRDWRKKHWMTMYYNYKNTPHFKDYAPFLEAVYKREWHTLHEINEHMLRWFLEVLDLKMPFHKALELKLEGSKSDLVLDMCKKLHADAFIFGKLGKDYAKKEDFDRERIAIYFQGYNHPTYTQQGKEFAPYMSVIDLLFNEGPKSLDIIMSGNITKEELKKELQLV